MEIEQLELDNFDIDTFEPPNFSVSKEFVPLDEQEENFDINKIIEQPDSDIESESEDEDEYEEEHYSGDNLEIDIEGEDLDFNENFDNIIYSYPFYCKDDIDYEYRVTINDDELLVEQVKCDDSKIDFEDSVEVFAEIYRGPLETAFDCITKNIDLRDGKTILQEGIIDYNFEGNIEDLKQKIEKNKISVLFEMYKEIIDSVYE
jgi:hypothetical protein